MKKFDPGKEPAEHREFYGKTVLISKDTVADYIKTHIDSQPVIDWNDYWGRVVGPIRRV
jgi:ribose transport system substrate-binding protein